MTKPTANVALKTALFATGIHQQRLAKIARIAPQKLSHTIHGRRDLDAKERQRLISALRRFGVTVTESQLFPSSLAVSA